MLPAGLVGRCERGARIEDAVLAGFEGKIRDAKPIGIGVPLGETRITPRPILGLTCRPDAGARRLYVMEPARGPDSDPGQPEAVGDTYVGYLAARWRIPEGSCASDPRAFERWRERQGTGLLACMNPYDGRPWVYFSLRWRPVSRLRHPGRRRLRRPLRLVGPAEDLPALIPTHPLGYLSGSVASR